MKFYIYLHRRPDTGDVFYVGRGKLYKRSTVLPRRAYTKNKRNIIWHGIVERNGGKFSVEIVQWCETAEEVNQVERDTIKKFGKIIDGTGTLCNLTDGGEGAEGYIHTNETKNKLKQAHAKNPARAERLKSKEFIENSIARRKGNPGSMLGKSHSDNAKLKMSFSRKGGKHYAAKLVVNTDNGIFYDCVEDAANSINLNKWTLYKALKGERANHTVMRYADGL